MLADLVDDRREQLDRHEHVDRARAGARLEALDDERAEAAEPAFAVDERRAGPAVVRRRREHGLIEHVLPAAREFLLRDDARVDALLLAAAAHDGDGVADRERIGAAELHRRAVQRQRRLDEREPAVEVVADDEAGHDGVARADPEVLGLVHDVADRRDQAVVANPHAVADALGAEQPGAHRVLGHVRRDRHDARR